MPLYYVIRQERNMILVVDMTEYDKIIYHVLHNDCDLQVDNLSVHGIIGQLTTVTLKNGLRASTSRGMELLHRNLFVNIITSQMKPIKGCMCLATVPVRNFTRMKVTSPSKIILQKFKKALYTLRKYKMIIFVG